MGWWSDPASPLCVRIWFQRRTHARPHSRACSKSLDPKPHNFQGSTSQNEVFKTRFEVMVSSEKRKPQSWFWIWNTNNLNRTFKHDSGIEFDYIKESTNAPKHIGRYLLVFVQETLADAQSPKTIFQSESVKDPRKPASISFVVFSVSWMNWVKVPEASSADLRFLSGQDGGYGSGSSLFWLVADRSRLTISFFLTCQELCLSPWCSWHSHPSQKLEPMSTAPATVFKKWAYFQNNSLVRASWIIFVVPISPKRSLFQPLFNAFSLTSNARITWTSELQRQVRNCPPSHDPISFRYWEYGPGSA